jgi:hypothetical protein
MKSQHVDRSLETSAIATSLDDLIRGYILNCRCENKSATTISSYGISLTCFKWYCGQNGYPDEPQKIVSHHIDLYAVDEQSGVGF